MASPVPERVGIAGFHDLEIGRVISPTLSTVHVPALEIGRKAGEMIVARLAGHALDTSRHQFGFEIIGRQSTMRSGIARQNRLTADKIPVT